MYPPCLSALKLQTLVKENLLSEFMFLFIPETTSDLQGSKQVQHILASFKLKIEIPLFVYVYII